MVKGRPGERFPPSRRAFCLSALAIALGRAPVAASDVGGYRDWAVAPELPSGVLDLGSRFEPNLERLTELRPDLIVASRGYGAARAARPRRSAARRSRRRPWSGSRPATGSRR